MSLYREFMEECTNWKVHEGPAYFITYRKDKSCGYDVLRIRNLFIAPSHRDGKVALKVRKKVFELAKELGVGMISGELYFENPHFNRWVNFYRNIGFEVLLYDNQDKHVVVYCTLDKDGKIVRNRI